MSRRDPGLQTHTWLFANKARDVLAYVFIFLLICFAIAVASVHAIVEHDCKNWYERDMKIFSKWLHLEVGSTKQGCPVPYNERDS